MAILGTLNGITPAAMWEGYHALIGRSVTHFIAVQWRKASLLFCGAKCRILALSVISRDAHYLVVTGGNADMGLR
jgi:hypothetical protein